MADKHAVIAAEKCRKLSVRFLHVWQSCVLAVPESVDAMRRPGEFCRRKTGWR